MPVARAPQIAQRGLWRTMPLMAASFEARVVCLCLWNWIMVDSSELRRVLVHVYAYAYDTWMQTYLLYIHFFRQYAHKLKGYEQYHLFNI